MLSVLWQWGGGGIDDGVGTFLLTNVLYDLKKKAYKIGLASITWNSIKKTAPKNEYNSSLSPEKKHRNNQKNETKVTTTTSKKRPEKTAECLLAFFSLLLMCMCMFKITGLFFVVFRVFGAHSNENVHSARLFSCVIRRTLYARHVEWASFSSGCTVFAWILSPKIYTSCTLIRNNTQTEYHGRLRRKHLATTSTRR